MVIKTLLHATGPAIFTTRGAGELTAAFSKRAWKSTRYFTDVDKAPCLQMATVYKQANKMQTRAACVDMQMQIQ